MAKTTTRPYEPATDFDRVSSFLVETYRTTGGHINWLQPRWEYMHFHPNILEVDLESFGLWQSGGDIVAVAHLEHEAGTAHFQVDPVHSNLKRELLAYAEDALSVPGNGGRRLTIYLNDVDLEFQAIGERAGYRKRPRFEPMSHLPIPGGLSQVSVPDGFRLKSLAEGNDRHGMHRLLHRGFNHGNEPPGDGTDERDFMQSAPNYALDLNIVVEAPSGQLAACCGTWYEPVRRIAYVEPVATDPDYRRMGLARAALLEGLHRCAARGATVAYVGSGLPIYLALGFRQTFRNSAWERAWS